MSVFAPFVHFKKVTYYFLIELYLNSVRWSFKNWTLTSSEAAATTTAAATAINRQAQRTDHVCMQTIWSSLALSVCWSIVDHCRQRHRRRHCCCCCSFSSSYFLSQQMHIYSTSTLNLGFEGAGVRTCISCWTINYIHLTVLFSYHSYSLSN